MYGLHCSQELFFLQAPASTSSKLNQLSGFNLNYSTLQWTTFPPFRFCKLNGSID